MGRHGENIRKRKDGRWEGRYKVSDTRKGMHPYRSVYGYAYDEVKEKLSKARLGIANQTAGESLTQKAVDNQENDSAAIMLLFSQVAGEWLEEIAEKRKYSTYVKYDSVYKAHIAEALGACRISGAATTELQEKIFDHLSQKVLSESLQKSICCIVNQILDFANRKYLLHIPSLKNPPVKQKKKLVETLLKAEQARLLGHIYDKPDKFKTAVLLCLYTGLRLGELCALQWTDLDFRGRTLTVNRTVQRIAMQGCTTKTILMETDPKSESSKRIIPLTDGVVGLLFQLKGEQSYVFGKEKPLDPRTMQYQFKRILKTAEIDNRNFHILRHTFATNCIENGMDVKVLSEILGHSDVKITLNRYIHPTMDSKKKQLEMLPDFYGQICGQEAGTLVGFTRFLEIFEEKNIQINYPQWTREQVV